jgi:hypothetical protein
VDTISRDNFSAKVLETLYKRVAGGCSNPMCGRPTSGPNTDPAKWVNIGVAAHITAASKGGPRYNESLTSDERMAAENGIWLCQWCSKLIDSDVDKYPAPVLVQWKKEKEAELEGKLNGGVPVGLALQVSELIPIYRGADVVLESGERVPRCYLKPINADPTFYSGGLVYRVVLRPGQPSVPTLIQFIAVEVQQVEPIPDYRPLRGAYPTALSLYEVVFADPKVAETDRFVAEKYYRVRENNRSEGSPYQPVMLDAHIPETFDIRLSSTSPGLFVLRLFASVSVGASVKEQYLGKAVKVLVPEP